MKKSTWLVVGLCALALPAAGVVTLSRFAPAPAAAQATRSRKFQGPPRIVSEVPSLQVERTEIVPFGPDSEHLLLTLRNHSEKKIVFFTLCSDLDERGYSGVTFLGPEETDEAVAPYGERTERLPADEWKPGRPLIICGATFEDGTREGAEYVREAHKERYEKHKEERRKRKGVN